MKYIEKIILKNFQSHDYTELDLSRGVNVIVGPSDSGKTAIMRALRWNLFNEPSGVDFVREGESEVSVTIRFQDRVEIVRLRSKSKNQYILREPDEDEVIFEGFGTYVPQEIREVTGIYKVMLDDKKSLPLNFSDQLEGPFLLQETDAYKAQAIGRMVGVDVLDEAMRNTLRDKKQLSTQKDLIESEIEQTEKSLEVFHSLDEKLNRRDKLNAYLHKLKTMQNRLEEAKRHMQRYQNIKDERGKVISVLREYDHLDAVKDQLLLLESKARRYTQNRLLMDSYIRNRREHADTKNLIEQLDNGNTLDELFRSLYLNNERLTTIQPLHHAYQRLRDDLNTTKNTLNRLSSIDEYRGEELLANFARFKERQEILRNYRELQDRLRRGREFMDQFKSIDRVGEILVQSEKEKENIKIFNVVLASWKELSTEQDNCKKVLTEAQTQTQNALDDYMSALSRAGTCPLCRQPIDEEHLTAIKKSLED